MTDTQQLPLELAVELRETARKRLGQISCTGNPEVKRGLARQAFALLQESEELRGGCVGMGGGASGNLVRVGGPVGAASAGSPIAGTPEDRERDPGRGDLHRHGDEPGGSQDVEP